MGFKLSTEPICRSCCWGTRFWSTSYRNCLSSFYPLHHSSIRFHDNNSFKIKNWSSISPLLIGQPCRLSLNQRRPWPKRRQSKSEIPDRPALGLLWPSSHATIRRTSQRCDPSPSSLTFQTASCLCGCTIVAPFNQVEPLSFIARNTTHVKQHLLRHHPITVNKWPNRFICLSISG